MRSKSLALVVALFVGCCVCDFALAQKKGGGNGGGGGDPEPVGSYEVVALDDVSGQYTDAWARDINDSGVVVGHAEDSGSAWVAVCWTTAYAGGQLTTQLKVLDGGTGGAAYGINNLGEIVGGGLHSSGNDRGLYWPSADSEPLSLTPLASHSVSWAYSLNEDAVICGWSGAQQYSSSRPVIWRVGVDEVGKPKIFGPFELPTLGLDGLASAINTRGEGFADVVGHLVVRDEEGKDIGPVAVRWSLQLLPDGTLAVDDPVILDVQVSPYGEAYSVNNNGEICGMSGPWKEAVVWSDGQARLLPWAEGVLGAIAEDISTDGTVVGEAVFPDSRRGIVRGVDRAVVWPSGTQEMVNLNDFLPKRSALQSLQRAEAVNTHGEIVGDAGVGAFIAVPK